MKEVEVGEIEKREIRAQVDRVLRDLGNPEPPLNLSDVRSLLSLDLQYYRSSDPGLVTELGHRFRLLARKTLPDLGRHLLNALGKSRLCAFWVPESARILVDEDVPKKKHRWIEAHEITHSITRWHKHFLLGDNSKTLDPDCHAVLEAEANYGAGRLLFLQDRFAADARDLELSFDSIKALAKRYDNSILSTFWRSIEERDPTLPAFGIISIHPHHPEVGQHDGADPWRYFIRSAAFRLQFANVSPRDVYELVTQSASYRRTGPILSSEHSMVDVSGGAWEFQIDSFSTGHALLTCGRALRMRTVLVGTA